MVEDLNIREILHYHQTCKDGSHIFLTASIYSSIWFLLSGVDFRRPLKEERGRRYHNSWDLFVKVLTTFNMLFMSIRSKDQRIFSLPCSLFGQCKCTLKSNDQNGE